MTANSTRRRPRAQILLYMWNLYTYIYCMLTSQALVEMAIFGGALYMSMRVSVVFFSTYAGEARFRLPEKERRWRTAIMILLLILTLSIFVIYPSRLDNPSLWMLFALVICLSMRDGLTERLIRRGFLNTVRLRSALVYACLHLVPAVVIFSVYLFQLEGARAWPLCLGYLIGELLSLIAQRALILDTRMSPEEHPTHEQLEKLQTTLGKVSMYKVFSIITQLIAAALELTMVLLYTRFGTDSAQTLLRVAIAAAVSLLSVAAADRWFNRRQRHQTSDPVNLMLVGLFLWFFGLNLLRRGHEPFPLSSLMICLGLCTAGSTLCHKSMDRMESAMARVVRFAGGENIVGYHEIRVASMEWAQLLGQMIALAAMTYFCLRNPRNPLALTDINTPLLTLAPLLAVLAALIFTFRFPLSNRILEKISRLLRLQEVGASNPALENQLQKMVIDKYARPFIINASESVIRFFYRYRLVGSERIRRDDENPLVFLCNHGFVNGPVISMSYLPVLARPWVIDKVSINVDEVTTYLYHNDFENNEKLPKPLRYPLAHLFAKICVWLLAKTEPIHVFRDNPGQLIRTFRASVEALQAGDNLLIFPENPNGIEQSRGYEVDGLGPLFSGFAMLAPIYYRRTGKKCRFMPMYVHKEARVVIFGEEILYDPENPDNETERISACAEAQMRELMAKAAEMPRPDRRGKRTTC